MSETPVRLGQREQQIVELLLQGCDNDEIARQLKMARRTVKAHFNRLFLRFGINGGIKRVKLATLLYRRQLWMQAAVTENESPANGSTESLNSLPKDLKTKRLQTRSEPLSTSSRTTFASYMTSLASGTALNLPSGMKPADSSRLLEPDVREAWEESVLGLGEN
jgi:Bacterial regulatory proteins, luxR family